MARIQPCTATLVKLRKLVPGLQKHAPCFAHYGCVPGLYPEEKYVVTTSIHSATPTKFYCRAVMLKLDYPIESNHNEKSKPIIISIVTKNLNGIFCIGTLLLFTLASCEKIANETDPAKIILGKWEIIQIGNEDDLEPVDNPFGYNEYLLDSIKVEFASDTDEYFYKKYWIDTLLTEGVYLQDTHEWFITGRYEYRFYDKNEKMRLEYVNIAATYTTFIYQRIK